MANNDPTGIVSAIVAVPFAIAGNGIQYVVSNLWRMNSRAAAALEARNQLDANLDQMERGQLLQEEHINRGRDLVIELRNVADEANTISMINLPRRFEYSRKLDKRLQAYEEYNRTHGIQMILKEIQNLKLQRQDASFYLFSPPSCDSQLIQVGMDNNVERLTSLLVESETRWISITGMGGMGKSFLAQIVCNDPRVREYFGSILWVDCGHCGHQDLYRKLRGMQEDLHLCFTGRKASFTTLDRGNQVMRELIKSQSSQPYLLVLDNVQSRLVLKVFDLLGGGRIGKTIVTSRQQDILRDIDENDKKGLWVGGLSREEACQLFCKHAFRDEVPPIELTDYVMKFVEHCGGMPLMLEVLGKYMRPKTRAVEWECVLKQIKKKKLSHKEHDHVFELLRISYDALHDRDKKMFLYLATSRSSYPLDGIQVFHCWRGIDLLSQDEDIDIVKEEYIEALNRLSSASLIRVDCFGVPNRIRVSGMIRELADYIVTEDNLLNHSLRRNTRWTEVVHESFICSTAASIEINDGDNISSLDYFSRFSNLRSLTLRSLKNLRMFDSAHMDPLSICQLRYLDIVFEEPSKLQPLYNALQQLSKLEFLRIYSAAHVEDTTLDVGFLSNMPELNRLLLGTPLEASTKVINCHHIQELQKLEYMSLPFFLEHWDWPPPKDLKKLYVNISYSEGDRNFMECNGAMIPFMTSLCASATLEGLDIRGVRFLEVPELHLPSLKWLHLEVAKERLPRGWLQSLPCLETLVINGGGKLMELPSLDKLPNLKRIKLSGLAAEQLHITPEESASLSNLDTLEIVECENLENISTLEFLPSTEFSLELRRCGKLLHLPPMPNCSSLTLDGLVTLQNMRGFPQVAGKLRFLRVADVATMKHLPELVCPKLARLEIWHCPEMETLLPDDTRFSSCFPKQTVLSLGTLPKLVRLPASLGDSLPNCEVRVTDCPSLNPPSSQ